MESIPFRVKGTEKNFARNFVSLLEETERKEQNAVLREVFFCCFSFSKEK